jgi:PAS domain S-box-containing protein/putative nucleotidyltransferase with HDIG domain
VSRVLARGDAMRRRELVRRVYKDRDADRVAQEALLDAVAAPAFFIDRSYRYLAFNEANRVAVRFLYGREVATGDKLLDTIANAADRETLKADIDRSLAGETHSHAAWYGNDATARRFYDITYAPYVRDGVVLGVAAVAVDVTAMNETEAALRLSEEKFEAAFQASPDAINLNRLSDGLYLEINRGFTRFTGYTAQDVRGKTSLELPVWDDPADRERLVRCLEATGACDRLEARFRSKNGSVSTGEMSASIVTVAGEPCILSVTRDTTERKRILDELRASYARLERMTHDVVQALGRVAEARDPYTQGHEERTAELCRLIAKEMRLPDADVAMIETAALVHDIGKLSVPAEILTKPGKLSPMEFALIKEHPQHGYEILSEIAFDEPIADIVLEHHERMDGTGYPRGLHGDEILPLSRILSVADVVEAMATHRPYRPSLGLAAAVDELRSHPEKYDAAVVAAFLELCNGDCVHL